MVIARVAPTSRWQPRRPEPVAARWMGLGYQAFVVRYKHYVVRRQEETGGAPEVDEGSRIPEQLVDLMAAMRIVHEHAAEWDIDEDRIYCMGFSAGAHLVGSLAERFDEQGLLERAGATAAQVKPAGVVMGYPMINAGPALASPDEVPPQMLPTLALIKRALFGTDAPTQEQIASIDLVAHVRPDMPRVFAWHSTEDVVVNPADTLAFFGALQAEHVPCELHFYRAGSARHEPVRRVERQCRRGHPACERAVGEAACSAGLTSTSWTSRAERSLGPPAEGDGRVVRGGSGWLSSRFCV